MFTKGQASTIKSLHNKKNREKTGLFLVEGEKSILETFSSDYKIKNILATKNFQLKYSELFKTKDISIEIVEQGEIEKVSTLETNNSVLAVVYQKKVENNCQENNSEEIILALDNVRDPGNLGTIIRIADWYGIKKIIASIGTVDFYNPKVISATKGSFTRVNIFYTDLEKYIKKVNTLILGAFMNGENVHSFCFPKSGILVMGNESNGITKEIEKLVTQKITIPSFGQATNRAESLNVAIATAILIDNWKKGAN